MRSRDLRPGLEAPVKVEIEDSPTEHHLTKRSKLSSSAFQEQWRSNVTGGFPIPPPQYNPLDEPSPLGLRLRKSPSLLDLIQMRLSQEGVSVFEASPSKHVISEDTKEDFKGILHSGEKLKASNFPASFLRIGCWEFKSRYEGDLVAKCYFAKHKLVWEVLKGGLKSKIEVQWSDIMCLKANCPDNGLGTLNVVLARQPLFFRETNPQPRKHTLWQATADFTDGQASLHRVHFLQCPQGVLNKHFEKLIQCDTRLNLLSQQPEIALDSPYFEQQPSAFENLNDTEPHSFNKLVANKGSTSSRILDATSLSALQSSSMKIGRQDPVRATEQFSLQAPSPSSVMDAHAIEGSGCSESEERSSAANCERPKIPRFHRSLSISDLVTHVGNRISEQMNSGNPPVSLAEGSEFRFMLDDIAQHLLGDSQQTAATSDEISLMSRVNSLCCLLQKDPASADINGVNNAQQKHVSGFEGNHMDAPSSKPIPQPAMPRMDSYGDLLLHLPRIASLPRVLSDISENGEK